MLGGPLGALFGAAFGHNFDQGLNSLGGNIGLGANLERIQTVFFTATFSIMGHLAKADGQVTQVEIDVAENIMRQMKLNAEQRKAAQKLFSEGKQSNFPLDDVLHQFRMECHRRRSLLQMFLEIQVAIAMSDGKLHANERKLLEHIASQLGFSRADYEAILQGIRAQQHAHTAQQGMSLEDAYKLLSVPSSASDQDVKKAYRRQMNQHHPDKLVSKGLPEEMMELANRKAQDIKTAYEAIKASRKH